MQGQQELNLKLQSNVIDSVTRHPEEAVFTSN
jgi:hypothetical protein